MRTPIPWWGALFAASLLSAWIKVTSPNNYNFVLCKELNSGTYAGAYIFVYNDNKFGMALEYDNSYYTMVTGSRNVADGGWHHVAGVNLATGGGSAADIRLYVDGALEAATTTLKDNLGARSILNNTPVTIGSREGGVGFLWWVPLTRRAFPQSPVPPTGSGPRT